MWNVGWETLNFERGSSRTPDASAFKVQSPTVQSSRFPPRPFPLSAGEGWGEGQRCELFQTWVKVSTLGRERSMWNRDGEL